jgi:hypothetical protein
MPLTLPAHVALSIEHQPHAAAYQTAAEWLAVTVGVLDAVSVLMEDRASMLALGEVWVVRWYPDTPVGCCAVAAATLERALALACGGAS